MRMLAIQIMLPLVSDWRDRLPVILADFQISFSRRCYQCTIFLPGLEFLFRWFRVRIMFHIRLFVCFGFEC